VTQQTTTADAASRHDVATTMRNALKLGVSLVVTLGIGFGVRIALRRYLGPSVIGPVNFADAFTTTAFVFLSLGIDTHVRRVVPVNVDSGNAFLGTVFTIRALLSGAVFLSMAAVLEWMNQPPEVRALVWAYGAAQLCLSFNNTFAAMLQSARTIDGLSALNVACKLIWAAGFIATMVFQWPLLGIPLSVLVAEVIRLPISYWLVRKHTNLRLTVDWKKIGPVLRGSLPFYVNAVALVVVNRFDVNVLKVRSNDTEIGLYSAAAELAQMTFVLVPMLSGVVMPLFARMQSRSKDEYQEVVRRTLELVLVLAFPPSLAIAVGADVWVGLVLGEQYAASAWALSILGPTFLLTYTAVVISQTLNLGGEGWTVTLTSLMSMFVHPLMVMVLVGFANDWGTGGAGAACAIAAVVSEALVLTIMMYRIGGWVVDKRLLKMVGKTLLACVAVMVIDRFLLVGFGPSRILIDGVIYALLVLGSGAVTVGETMKLVRTMRAQRAGVAADPPNDA
jgi:O-antigen/teichoic acid export membrane protein